MTCRRRSPVVVHGELIASATASRPDSGASPPPWAIRPLTNSEKPLRSVGQGEERGLLQRRVAVGDEVAEGDDPDPQLRRRSCPSRSGWTARRRRSRARWPSPRRGSASCCPSRRCRTRCRRRSSGPRGAARLDCSTPGGAVAVDVVDAADDGAASSSTGQSALSDPVVGGALFAGSGDGVGEATSGDEGAGEATVRVLAHTSSRGKCKARPRPCADQQRLPIRPLVTRSSSEMTR